MVEEEWKEAYSWPPAHKMQTFYLSEQNVLSEDSPQGNTEYDDLIVNFSAGTGSYTRWKSLVNIQRVPIVYEDRAEVNNCVSPFAFVVV